MTQYIPKSALVAEINKRIIDAPINNIGHQRVWAYNDVKDIINTLEVKEVDLTQEIEQALNNLTDKDMRGWFKHFFELGMAVSNKAQKGE